MRDTVVPAQRLAQRLAAARVPQAHGLVIAARGYEGAVRAEGDAPNVAVVPAQRLAPRLAATRVPQAYGSVLVTRGHEGAVRTEGNVVDVDESGGFDHPDKRARLAEATQPGYPHRPIHGPARCFAHSPQRVVLRRQSAQQLRNQLLLVLGEDVRRHRQRSADLGYSRRRRVVHIVVVVDQCLGVADLEPSPDPLELDQQVVQFGLRTAQGPVRCHLAHEIGIGESPSAHADNEAVQRVRHRARGVGLGVGIRTEVVD